MLLEYIDPDTGLAVKGYGSRACGAYVTFVPFTDSEIVIGTNNGTAWTKLTPAAGARRVTIRNQDSSKFIRVASGVMHKTPDLTTIAATVPAVSEAESYALATELKGDYNTHIASTAYHVTADAGTCSLANATNEATLVALVNNLRTLLSTHLASETIHGGVADAANLALVEATTVATNAATAIVLENALAPIYAAHILITSAGVWEKLPAATALVWEAPQTPVWFQLESNGTYSARTDS